MFEFLFLLGQVLRAKIACDTLNDVCGNELWLARINDRDSVDPDYGPGLFDSNAVGMAYNMVEALFIRVAPEVASCTHGGVTHNLQDSYIDMDMVKHITFPLHKHTILAQPHVFPQR